MRMILRAFPVKWYTCQCMFFRDGKYYTVEYSSIHGVFKNNGNYSENYEELLKRTNSYLLGLL